MLEELLADAEAGRPVYITRVHDSFSSLPPASSEELGLVVDLLDSEGQGAWKLRIPRLGLCAPREKAFVREYLRAEVYNILSSLGARRMRIFADRSSAEAWALAEGLSEAFCVDAPRSERRGYGRSINVLDRMAAALRPGDPPFRFSVEELSAMPSAASAPRPRGDGLSAFRRCAEGLGGKAFCGIDVGGTDIKAVLVEDGRIVDYKEYDWFPAAFRRSRELVEPICLIARLLRARLWLERAALPDGRRSELLAAMSAALDKKASDAEMERLLAELEEAGLGRGLSPGLGRGSVAGPEGDCLFDGIGLCFPDVVVENKIVGGEVYKTRGIRNNPDIDYEADFAELTDLDERLSAWLRPGGKLRIINDGPMASFTAAVEIAASDRAEEVASGVFAHTLGTELGTGWVTESGSIPDIPLEVYNFIIDLGSWPERGFEPDDLRSVNNFNTGLPGTLQKYCSQSGVFRLALKYFPSERPELFSELEEKGYIAERVVGGKRGWYVPTDPVDQRKGLLEHLMSLPEREADETNFKIWRELGECLAATAIETRRILAPGTDRRFLFGRLVKNRRCFELMAEGARRVDPRSELVVAGTGMANSPLMRQLGESAERSVAQFAQAVGAVYFANLG